MYAGVAPVAEQLGQHRPLACGTRSTGRSVLGREWRRGRAAVARGTGRRLPRGSGVIEMPSVTYWIHLHFTERRDLTH